MALRITHVNSILAPLTNMSEPALEKLLGILSRADRFMSLKRRELRASDFGSLLNVLLSDQFTYALESDTVLHSFVYKGASAGDGAPVLGPGTWGEMLERLIRSAPAYQVGASEPAKKIVEPGTMPNAIEALINPPLITLIWYGPNGGPTRIEWYGPQQTAVSQSLVRKKVILDPRIIHVCADLLRTSVTNVRTKKKRSKKDATLPKRRQVRSANEI